MFQGFFVCGDLHFFIIACGVIDQLALFGEAGAVAWAIPRMLGAVVFQRATEVGTPWRGGGEEPYCGLQGVDGKLWA